MKYILAACVALLGINTASAADNQPWSTLPPDGLDPSQVPMFVSIGYDDNGKAGLPGASTSGGMTWSTDHFKNLSNPAGAGNPATYDGTPARVSYYLTTTYIEQYSSDSPTLVKRSWRTAYEDNHEIGVHTSSHATSDTVDLARWNTEIGMAIDSITKPFDPDEVVHTPNPNAGIGVPLAEITGFRTPFLQYNDATFTSVQSHGLSYDNSIEEGWQPELGGTNYPWPFTLDAGSPGNTYMLDSGFPNKHPMTNHPGLWEIPTHPVIVPPDSVAAQYGFTPGMRDRVLSAMAWFDVDSGKLTGFDYNMWAQAKMNKEDFVATMKYTLDLRLQGNRAPFTFGAHTDYYTSTWNGSPNTTATERQEAIEEFITYALSKPEVRVVPHQTIVDWMRDPNRGTFGGTTYTVDATAGADGAINPSGAVAVFEGSSKQFTFDPNPGFMIEDVLVDGLSVGAVTSYDFTNVVANHTISASFVAAPDFTITASAGAGGSITPSGAVVVAAGGSQVFDVAAEPGYSIENVLIDGVSAGTEASHTFGNVSANHTISASFSVVVPSGIDVDHKVSQDWGSGYCADIKMTNGGTSSTDGWILTWSFPSGQTVASLWNASYVQSGADVTVNDLGWNGAIAPGASVTVGYCANYSGTNTLPTDFDVQ